MPFFSNKQCLMRVLHAIRATDQQLDGLLRDGDAERRLRGLSALPSVLLLAAPRRSRA